MDSARRFAAQLEYLRGDERIRERAQAYASLPPTERLAQAWALGRAAIRMLDALPEDVRTRAEEHREPLGPGAELILRRLAGRD